VASGDPCKQASKRHTNQPSGLPAGPGILDRLRVHSVLLQALGVTAAAVYDNHRR